MQDTNLLLAVLEKYSFLLTVLLFIAWLVLASGDSGLIAFARRLVFLVFIIGCFYNYDNFASRLFVILQDIGVEASLRKQLLYYKGTDWFEGFVYGLTLGSIILIILFIAMWEIRMAPKSGQASSGQNSQTGS